MVGEQIQKRYVSNGKRRKVYQKSSNYCMRCGVNVKNYRNTIDHIIPISLGGSNNVENLTCLCDKCNKEKGSELVLPSSFYYVMGKEARKEKTRMVIDWIKDNITLGDIIDKPFIFDTLRFSVSRSKCKKGTNVVPYYKSTAQQFISMYKLEPDEIDMVRDYIDPRIVGVDRILEKCCKVPTYVFMENDLRKILSIITVRESEGSIIISLIHCKEYDITVRLINCVLQVLDEVYHAIEVDSVIVKLTNSFASNRLQRTGERKAPNIEYIVDGCKVTYKLQYDANLDVEYEAEIS